MMSDLVSGLVSGLVSVRVPTCLPEGAKLAMSDTIFRDRHILERLGGSAYAPPVVRYTQHQRLCYPPFGASAAGGPSGPGTMTSNSQSRNLL
jgi:hypothetical protein